jgi:hypothetical protein
MIGFSAPLAGLHRAAQILERTATRVAGAADPAGDSAGLSVEMIALLLARNLSATMPRF